MITNYVKSFVRVQNLKVVSITILKKLKQVLLEVLLVVLISLLKTKLIKQIENKIVKLKNKWESHNNASTNSLGNHEISETLAKITL